MSRLGNPQGSIQSRQMARNNMKQLKSFPNYFVTEDGDIYNSKGLKLKKQVNIDGYFVVNIYNESGEFHKRLCRLVAEAYLSDYSDDLVVNHKDLNKQNDHISNLEMVTTLENTRHSIRLQPERHIGNSSITEETVHKICNGICQGASNKELAGEFSVNRNLVSKIRLRKTWNKVSKHYEFPEHVRVADERCVREACILIASGIKPMKILKDLKSRGFENITYDVIKDIKSKGSWKHISDEYFG